MSVEPGQDGIGDELTTYSIDNEDQLQPEDTLVPGGDRVDDGFEAPHRLHGSVYFGTTAEEQAREETIEQRIRQEVPDPDTAYGAPENESGLDPLPMAGGDDPDAIPADADYIGEISGGMDGVDVEPSTQTEDIDMRASTSAEEAAMHIIPEESPDTSRS